ncbi:hypothetical protein BASA61_008133 [Batrachochytrium salamandrivorans]|nr:hypothetical protein BASA61_008133 [Batrachochytrium salamandrivorans]
MLGIFITCFGLISLVVKDKLYMSEAMVATLFGIIIGPAAANIFNPGLLFLDKLTTLRSSLHGWLLLFSVW